MGTSLWISWFLVALLIIISIVLLMGKGSFLIAGYNTLSKEKKQRYNRKRLCRVVGGGSGILALIVATAAIYRFEMPPAISWIIPWGLFGVVAVAEILACTVCKSKLHSEDK